MGKMKQIKKPGAAGKRAKPQLGNLEKPKRAEEAGKMWQLVSDWKKGAFKESTRNLSLPQTKEFVLQKKLLWAEIDHMSLYGHRKAFEKGESFCKEERDDPLLPNGGYMAKIPEAGSWKEVSAIGKKQV